MALSAKDIDRIGDKNKIMLLEALEEHRKTYHTPLERRVGKLQRTVYGFQVLWAGVVAFFGFSK